MTINISVPSNNETPEVKPRITVFGVGGAGGNAVNNMIRAELEGVDFVAANTDAQALSQSQAERRIQLGATITEGLGAGSRPDVGHAAAEEALDHIVEELNGANMAFITAGMGGGTGTGAAPVIARAAREQGILTVGVVTKPFQFEGVHRMRIAESGIEDIAQFVDTLIIIPNQNLFRVANEKTTFADAFKMADDVLYSGVRGVTDLMIMPGLINLDFADIRTVMSEMGKALMGTGEAEGERRALDAAEAAICNPLLDDISMNGASGVIINITGGLDMTLFEVDEAANRIRSEVDAEARIILGSTFDDSLEGRMRVSIVATGMDRASQAQPSPDVLDVVSWRERAAKAPEPASEEASSATVVAIHSATSVAPEEPHGGADSTGAGTADNDEAGGATQAEAEPTVETAVSEPPETPADHTDAEPPTEDDSQSAADAGDAFIPPPPVRHLDGDGGSPADPFAAAAMANGSGEPEKPAESKPAVSKGPSLFERVTGTGRAAKSVAEPAPPHATGSPEAEEKTVDNQSGMGGLDAADRISESQSEEDLLDIPAFLRRQAN
ncbi:MAG: cell division protein FtsZ [Rhodospirillales bacterium]|jgi:cell division protein FtsZ|nr:cell division protein FtsZ [Rhodospirillales bacterium]MDP6774395.1 cell division protein FtsZ [Rhodospirillales bacterium]